MTTVRDLITMSAKEAGILGVGQTLLSENINDGNTLLTRMIAQWQKRRWLVPMLIDVSAPGNGLISNPIGVGQYYNTPRPDKIQSAYFTLNNNQGGLDVSYELKPVWSYEDYTRIALKTLNSFPSVFFYDGAFPIGNVYIYPIPSSAYTIHLIVKGSLGDLSDLDQTITLPDEYQEAIHYNLALRMCSFYGIQPQAATGGFAKVALNTIKNANAQVPTLELPFAYRNGFGSEFGGGIAGGTDVFPTPRIITSNTGFIDTSDRIIFVNFAGPVTLNLGPAQIRQNADLMIKDISGNASANNITIVPNVVDVNGIDGFNPYTINSDFGAVRLQPSTLGWASIA